MASYKYSSSFGETFTYNGLGLNPIENFWEDIKSTFLSRPLDGAKIHNYFADKGFEGASNPLLSRLGGQEKIFIEHEGVGDDLPPFESHSIAKLVESLSVYRVLTKLGDSLNSEAGMNHIYSILDAASNVADQSLETIIDQLGDLLGGSLASDTIKADVELFYQAIELPESSDFGLVSITNYGNLTDFASLDNDEGNGYRYALVNLLPFAITANIEGTTAAEALYNLNDTSGNWLYSDQYLADRTLMLQYSLIRNVKDIESPSALESLSFTDIKKNLTFITTNTGPVQNFADRYIFGDEGNNFAGLIGYGGNDHLYGMGGSDILNGLTGDGDDTIRIRYLTESYSIEQIDGGLGINTIEGTTMRDVWDFSTVELINIEHIFDGGNGNDEITGTSNDDILIGGAGSDTLRGGAGSDTYQFSSGDGHDTINNIGADVTEVDSLLFDDVANDELWLSKSGDNLIVDVVGTDDWVKISDWYADDSNQLDTIEASNLLLHRDQVDQLVNAMAAFDVPDGVGAVVPEDVRQQLEPTLTSVWQVS